MPSLVHLSAGDLTLTLAPQVGGAVARFEAAGAALMRPAPDDLADAVDAACYPLVPFCNRVRDGRFVFDGRPVRLRPNLGDQPHPLHGQGWRAVWRVDDASITAATLAYDHEPDEWPWRYSARQTFELDDHGLTVRLTAINRAAGPMPCGLGLHPHFPCDARTILDTLATGVWTVDEALMPAEHRAAAGRYRLRERRICGADLDNGFTGWCGRAGVRWPNQPFGLDIVTPGAAHLQVYAPSAGGVFAIEPATHRNAALNLPQAQWSRAGLLILKPGEAMSLTTRFALRRFRSGPPR